MALAPHNPSGPVANAATLHLAASTPGFRILEICLTDVNWRGELTNEHVVFDHGKIRTPGAWALALPSTRKTAQNIPSSR